MRNKILMIIIPVLFILIIPSVSGASLDPTLPRISAMCDSTVGAPFACNSAIDNDVSTRWVSTNTPPYPHFIILGFDRDYRVTSVALNQSCIEYSFSGNIYAENGGIDVLIGSWSIATQSNLSISVIPTVTSAIKFNQLQDHTGGTGYSCAVEIWAFGVVQSGPVSSISWILALLALALFLFALFAKFPIAIFLSGFVVIFLGLQLFSETNSIVVGTFIWLLAIFVMLIAIRETMKEI